MIGGSSRLDQFAGTEAYVLDADGNRTAVTLAQDTHQRVLARVLSGPSLFRETEGSLVMVHGVPRDDLSIGEIARARMQTPRRAQYGPLRFPRDFWAAITLAFLAVGFAAYALRQWHFSQGQTS